MRTVYALSAMLRARGADVLVADTGAAAVETMKRESKIDAVLMDIMMPEMDGYEAMRQIRADAKWRSVPIVALTARAMQGEEQRCLEAGATAYQSKPIDAARLLPLLQKLLTA
jgi:CheY-like chemotaxis protein